MEIILSFYFDYLFFSAKIFSSFLISTTFVSCLSCCSSFFLVDEAEVSMEPRCAPTSTVAPSLAIISDKIPDFGAVTSMLTLSVSKETISSSS